MKKPMKDKMKIQPPEGYAMPEEVKDGDTFEELGTFTYDGGMLTITALGGVPLSDAEAEEEVVDEEAAAEAPMGAIGERIMGMA
jgi:hypothetical protein